MTAHERQLTDLDAAIGDGDHGANMRRGFDAFAAAVPGPTFPTFASLFERLGSVICREAGGAAGALYGTFFSSAADACRAGPSNIGGIASAVQTGVSAVKSLGKSTTGQKTLLDVLVPAADELSHLACLPSLPQDWRDRISATARAGLESTRSMRATRGRAAFLGERSVGHLDPGAMSGCLMIEYICLISKEYV